jgi:hypothetical protein
MRHILRMAALRATSNQGPVKNTGPREGNYTGENKEGSLWG